MQMHPGRHPPTDVRCVSIDMRAILSPKEIEVLLLPRDLLLREIARTLTLVREPEGARRGNEIQPSPLFAVIFSRLDKDPRRPHASIVARPTNEGGVAVGGERDGGALRCIASSPRADQFAALLGPDIVAAGVDPGRAHRGGKDAPWPAHDGGVTVGGQRDRGPL